MFLPPFPEALQPRRQSECRHARSRQEQALRVAAQGAAILDSSCAWRPSVCIGRGGGMAPAEQRNAPWLAVTPLPTRFSKEAEKNALSRGLFAQLIDIYRKSTGRTDVGEARASPKGARPRLTHEARNIFNGAHSTLNRNKAFKRRRRKPRWVFCSRVPFWDGN